MYFDTQKLSVGVNCFPEKNESFEIAGKTIFDMIYPIGSIYFSINGINPSTLFGGTWISWGSGRVPVSVNTSDRDFSSVEKTGGNSTHTHTLNSAAAMIGSNLKQANTLAFAARNVGNMGSTAYTIAASNVSVSPKRSHNTVLTGTTDTGANLQPYITCYMWKRTA